AHASSLAAALPAGTGGRPALLAAAATSRAAAGSLVAVATAPVSSTSRPRAWHRRPHACYAVSLAWAALAGLAAASLAVASRQLLPGITVPSLCQQEADRGAVGTPPDHLDGLVALG